MRILLTGASGLLGKTLLPKLGNHDVKMLSVRYSQEAQQTIKNVLSYKPDIIINCAAFTDVDMAEKKEMLDEVCGANWHIPTYLSLYSKCPIIQISTDYVFNGQVSNTHKYKETDRTDPWGIYGWSKLAAEKEIKKQSYILRTSWLFGHHKRGFMHLCFEDNHPSLYNKTYGTVTYAEDLADIIKWFAEQRPDYGIYHCCNTSEPKSKGQYLEGARMTYNTLTNVCLYSDTYDINPTPSRPYNTALNNDKLVNIYGEVPTAENAIERFIRTEIK